MKKAFRSIACLLLVAAVACGGIFGYRWHVAHERELVAQAVDALTERFFKVCGDGNLDEAAKTNLVAVMAEMEALLPRCDEALRDNLNDRRIDGAFLLGDWALAEKLMADYPRFSDGGRRGVIAKLRAHAAEERGDWACAYSNFTIFVESILAEDPASVEEADPYTDVIWTKDAILGFNKKRLARLADKLGRPDEAKRLRDEAHAHFAAAIEEMKGDELTVRAMREEDAK